MMLMFPNRVAFDGLDNPTRTCYHRKGLEGYVGAMGV